MIDVEQLRILPEQARAVMAGLSHEEANRRPAEGVWSVVECIEHLNIINRRYVPAIEASLRDAVARDLRPAGPVRFGVIERWLSRTMEPPYRMKFKAPKSVHPPSSLEPEVVLADFASIHERLVVLAREAASVHPTKARVASPISSMLKFSLGHVFAIIAAHDRRHIWQAEQVRSALAGGK